MRVAPPAPRPFPDTPRGRFLQHLGHYSLPALIGLAAINGFLYGVHGVAGLAGGWMVIALLSGSVFLGARHDSGMCEWCLTSMPLNAPDRVNQPRTRMMLRIRHPRQRYVLAAGAVTVAALVFPAHGWVLALTVTCFTVPLATAWAALYVHRKVEPWCPWCHPGGGGEDEVPEPDKPPGDRLPVPAGGGAA
jgi:hypothetical protein